MNETYMGGQSCFDSSQSAVVTSTVKIECDRKASHFSSNAAANYQVLKTPRMMSKHNMYGSNSDSEDDGYENERDDRRATFRVDGRGQQQAFKLDSFENSGKLIKVSELFFRQVH